MSEVTEQCLTWPEIEQTLAVCERVLLWGRPGTGKTYSAVHAPRPEGSPLFMVTATEETPAAELRGMFVPSGGGEFKWVDMVFLAWWEQGGRLVIDEVGRLSNDAVSLSLATFNDSSVAQMSLPNGKTVRPNRDVWRQVIGTTNSHPDDMCTALVERLFPPIQVDYPHDDAFNVLPASLRDAARNAVLSGRRDASASLRSWLSMAKLRTQFCERAKMSVDAATDLAAKAVWGNAAQPIVDAIKLVAAK